MQATKGQADGKAVNAILDVRRWAASLSSAARPTTTTGLLPSRRSDLLGPARSERATVTRTETR